jgi:hypothetical protein
MWFVAGAVIIGGFLGYVGGKLVGHIYIFFKEIAVVGVHSPLAIMEVGETDNIRSGLFYKPPRSTADLKQINGVITFTKSGSTYDLSNGGAANIKQASPTTDETLTGTTVGVNTLAVSGTDGTTKTFTPVTVHVETVDHQTSILDYYRLAVSIGIDYWLNGVIGNFIINTAKLSPKGLCDQWMDWAIDWLSRNHKCQICKLEKAVDTDGLDHNFVRVTMCDGTVYYFDAHSYSSDPIQTKADWEAAHGQPDPIGTYTVWSQEPCEDQ